MIDSSLHSKPAFAIFIRHARLQRLLLRGPMPRVLAVLSQRYILSSSIAQNNRGNKRKTPLDSRIEVRQTSSRQLSLSSLTAYPLSSPLRSTAPHQPLGLARMAVTSHVPMTIDDQKTQPYTPGRRETIYSQSTADSDLFPDSIIVEFPLDDIDSKKPDFTSLGKDLELQDLLDDELELTQLLDEYDEPELSHELLELDEMLDELLDLILVNINENIFAQTDRCNAMALDLMASLNALTSANEPARFLSRRSARPSRLPVRPIARRRPRARWSWASASSTSSSISSCTS